MIQPSSDKPMITDAMIEAGRKAYSLAAFAAPQNGPYSQTPDEYQGAMLTAIYRAMEAARPLADDPWQKGVKLRWARQLDQRPLAVVDLDCLTIASRFAPLSVTLEECPGVFPLGWFDIVAPEPVGGDVLIGEFIARWDDAADGVMMDADTAQALAREFKRLTAHKEEAERERDGLRRQGQDEGFAAAVAQLRGMSAQKPPASLHHAASLLADSLERSRIPCQAEPKP